MILKKKIIIYKTNNYKKLEKIIYNKFNNLKKLKKIIINKFKELLKVYNLEFYTLSVIPSIDIADDEIPF